MPKLSYDIQGECLMFLFLNSIAASLDGLIIGIGLRLSHIKLSKINMLTIWLGNFLIYALFLFLYYYFKLTFMTKTITTILYLFLAYHAWQNKETFHMKERTLSLLSCLILTLTHSLDGTIVSLSFVYQYHILHICCIFSGMSLLILLIGYYFAKIFKEQKKENYISTFLFLLLAFINQFL